MLILSAQNSLRLVIALLYSSVLLVSAMSCRALMIKGCALNSKVNITLCFVIASGKTNRLLRYLPGMLRLYLFKINIKLLVSLYIMHWHLLFLDKARLRELILVLRVFKATIRLRNIGVWILQIIRLIAALHYLIAQEQLLRGEIALVCYGGSLKCCKVFLTF